MAETIGAAILEWGLGELGFFLIGNSAIINTTLLIGAQAAYGSDQRRRMRNQARDAAMASLQDRQVMVRSAVQPRGVLYGRDKVGGQLADAFVTGSQGEYLHLVVAFYGHECDACETIYFNNIALPTPDGSGNINSGVFARNDTVATVEETTSGSITLAHTPSTITGVFATDGFGTDRVTTPLALTTGYTVAGAVVTFVAGAVTGRTYSVNYEWTSTSPRVRVKVHLGPSGQVADSDLVSESAGRWTSADIGAGITYIYFRLQYDQQVFGQIGLPEITAAWRGKKILDPRSSTTAWTDNWALCVRDWLRDTTYGLGCTSAEVPDSEINTAANIADEFVSLYSTGTVSVTNGLTAMVGSGTLWLKNAYPGLFITISSVSYRIVTVTDDTHLEVSTAYGGGTAGGLAYTLDQRRYTVNGTLGTESSPLDNLRQLLAAGAGTAVWVQGRWLVRAGAYVTPVLTLNEDHLADGAISIVPRASRRDQFNRVSGTYLDSTAFYAEKQFPPVVNATYKAADGGLELTREISLPLVTDSFRAQRLGKIALERSRQAMTVRLNCSHRAYDLAPTDTVSLTLARYGWSSKVFEVRSRRYTPGVGIEYTMTETVSTVWSWNLGEQTVYTASNATNLPNPHASPAALTSLACDSSATVNPDIAKTLVPRGLVTWTASTDIFVRQGGRIEVEWKAWNDANWQKAGIVTGDSTSAYISPLAGGTVILIRARAVNSMGRFGAWAYLTHSVTSGGQMGGGNLLVNSSFEVDTDANGAPDGWTAYTNGTTGTNTSALVTGGARDPASKALRLSSTNLGTASTDRVGVQQIVELSDGSGKTYTYSCSVYGGQAGTADLILHVNFHSGAGGTGSTLGTFTTTMDSPDAVWRRTNYSMVAPSTTVSAVVLIYMAARTSSAGAATVYVDEAQFERGAVPTAYAPRADELLAGVVTTPVIASSAATETGKATSASGTVTATETGGTGLGSAQSDVCQVDWTNSLGYTVPVEFSVSCSAYITRSNLGNATGKMRLIVWTTSHASPVSVSTYVPMSYTTTSSSDPKFLSAVAQYDVTNGTTVHAAIDVQADISSAPGSGDQSINHYADAICKYVAIKR